MAKLFYHAGFEELQPTALEAITDIASDYFTKLTHTVNIYREAEKKLAAPTVAEQGKRFVPRFTNEEVVLHSLNENGTSIEGLDNYVKDDVDRLGNKLGAIYERMKLHLTELLRPALVDVGADGAGAFNDGSEQFVGGDFAEDLGEDFFGFRALGLDKELGLDMVSVPLHLLQSRVRNIYRPDDNTNGTVVSTLLDNLPPFDPVTITNVDDQIGLIRNFFLSKLHANNDEPLVEDEDLPVKQRRPRPRLGATGKIVSPQKRPPKEQIALAKKKKKLETAAAQAAAGGADGAAPKSANATPEKPGGGKKKVSIAAGMNGTISATAPAMERVESTQSMGGTSQTDRDEANGMMSPESLER